MHMYMFWSQDGLQGLERRNTLCTTAPHILGNEVDGGACGFSNVPNKKLGSLWIPANGLLF